MPTTDQETEVIPSTISLNCPSAAQLLVDQVIEDVIIKVVQGEDQDQEPSSPESTDTMEDKHVAHEQPVYDVKWIIWNERSCPVITQNENGPCPLISILNVLLLRGSSKISLIEGCEVVTSEQLMEFLADTIVQSIPKEMSNERRLDYEANMNEAIGILPKMQTGLDVNVRFTGVRDFEYTPECIIFDLLNISLYHGWLVDPANEMDLCSVIQQLSYNQLVEKIISDKTSEDSNLVAQSLLAQQFLESSASQLTYHGLVELNSNLKDGEIAVFFRNNHFSTILKRKEEMFILVTDQGFLKEPKVVWETLDSVDGDVLFVDETFQVVPPKPEPEVGQAASNSPTVPLTQEQQIDQDLLLAVTLQEEDKRCRERDQEWENKVGDTSGLTDEELAKRLQEEGNEAAAAAVAQQQQQQGQQGQQSSVPSSTTSTSSPGRRAATSGSSAQPSNSGSTSPSQAQRGGSKCIIL